MVGKLARCASLTILACLALGCATRFSPETIREEIELQRGREPLSVFELNLGRFTTLLIKSAMTTKDGKVPFSGLEQLQLAVYEAPAESGPVIDVTRIAVRGWEPLIRTFDESRSAMVLVRSSGESIGDLVVVGAGRKKVAYARLRGKLSDELPAALGDALRDGGPDALREMLTELAQNSP